MLKYCFKRLKLRLTSNASLNIYTEHPRFVPFKADFKKIHVTPEELWIFFDYFQEIDKDSSYTVSVDELFEFLRVKRSPFLYRCFALFDEDHSGELDFREFVITLWNYCTLSKNAFTLFAFDLYDCDDSGRISLEELAIVVKEIYGADFISNANAQKILRNFTRLHQFCPNTDDGKSEELDIKQFQEFTSFHPTLLWPAFQVQDLLRLKFGGKHFWAKLSKRRFHLSDGEYMNMEQLLLAHIDGDKFQEIILRKGQEEEEKEKCLDSALDIVNTIGLASARKKDAKFVNPLSYTLSSGRNADSNANMKCSDDEQKFIYPSSGFMGKNGQRRKAKPLTINMISDDVKGHSSIKSSRIAPDNTIPKGKEANLDERSRLTLTKANIPATARRSVEMDQKRDSGGALEKKVVRRHGRIEVSPRVNDKKASKYRPSASTSGNSSFPSNHSNSSFPSARSPLASARSLRTKDTTRMR